MPNPLEQDDANLTNLLPARLREDLSAAYTPTGDVPQAVDAAIVDMAHEKFARQRRSRLLLRAIGLASAAASIVLMIWLAHQGPSGRSVTMTDRTATPAPATTPLEGDVDRNGRIDIRDAFLLARRLEARDRAKPQWDLDGDGRVDRNDVDRLAMAAVKLDEGSVQ